METSLAPVIQALLNTEFAKPYKDEYVYVRCPLCGDSTKHHDAAHCSIWIKPGQPLIYHCWVCEESGIVNTNFLQALGINDIALFNQVGLYNNASKRGMKLNTSFKYRPKEKDYIIPAIEDNDINRNKLNYMRNRIGVPFTYKSIEALRIVFKLTDYLKINEVPWNDRYKKQMYFLDLNSIGFVSGTRDTVNLRSIEKDPKIRYIKYPLYEDGLESEQLYMLPTGADIFAEDVDLHITEGPFDILGVFFNVMNGNTNNQIYAAVGGSAYARVFRFFLRKGFNTNLNVHIYSDSDKSVSFYNKFIEQFRPWVKSISIYYNMENGEKDFGVPRDRIKIEKAVEY
jgi:hypothetical protein